MKVSATVWRKGWQREAAATQAAACEIATVIAWLQHEGLSDAADIFRRIAMRRGVQETAKDLGTAARRIRIHASVNRP
jgi:hypothetical protein